MRDQQSSLHLCKKPRPLRSALRLGLGGPAARSIFTESLCEWQPHLFLPIRINSRQTATCVISLKYDSADIGLCWDVSVFSVGVGRLQKQRGGSCKVTTGARNVMEVVRWEKPFLKWNESWQKGKPQLIWFLPAGKRREFNLSPNPQRVLLTPGWLRCYLRLPDTVDEEEKRAERRAVWCTAGCNGHTGVD